MRRMKTRQAIYTIIILTLLAGLSACSASNESIPTATLAPTLTPTVTATFTPSPIPPTATPTPLTCLTQPGEVRQDVVPNTKPPQEFLIYLPPCYGQMGDMHYPVIYLLHGQTFTDDQWVRMGVPEAADQLIHSGEAQPFIVVFPDDRYWNADAGAGFGDRLIFNLIPYVDTNYKTLADRNHRAIGGLSRGGGWTARLGFTHADLFGAMGLHSPAIFVDDQPVIEYMIKNIPLESRPRLWLDIGDADKELKSGIQLEEILTRNEYLHEYHRFVGDHTEVYWSAHVDEYLRWYTEIWNDETPNQ